MSLLVPERRFDPRVLEIMDRPDADPTVLRQDLKNLRLINRFFGGLAAIQKNILPLIRNVDPGKEIRILDLATGSADHPRALVTLINHLQRSARITAVDKTPLMLQVARERTKDMASILIEEGDLLNLTYADKSFDIVLCSLAIHHFSHIDAVKILREMKRLSQVGFIVNDLNRSWPAAWTAWLYTHLTTRNPMTLFDSYYSVLRSFRVAEMKQLAEEAGIQRYAVKTEPMFRLILVGEQ